MPATPICKCKVRYIGSSVPTQTKHGLQALQQPLSERYPETGVSEARGIDAWLSVWSNGILLEYIQGEKDRKEAKSFFPISTLHYCAAVRFVLINNYEGTGTSVKKFIPLDSSFAEISKDMHPPIFAAILRRTTGVKVLECHAFICRNATAANALVRCCFHSFASSKFEARATDTTSFVEHLQPPMPYIEKGGSMYGFPIRGDMSVSGGRYSLRSLPAQPRPHVMHTFRDPRMEPLYATPISRSMYNIPEGSMGYPALEYPPPLSIPPPPGEPYVIYAQPESVRGEGLYMVPTMTDHLRDRAIYSSSERLVWTNGHPSPNSSPWNANGHFVSAGESLSAHSDSESPQVAERIVHGEKHGRQKHPGISPDIYPPGDGKKSKKHKHKHKRKHQHKEKRSQEEPTYMPSARPTVPMATFDAEHPDRYSTYIEQEEQHRHKHHHHKQKHGKRESKNRSKHRNKKERKHKDLIEEEEEPLENIPNPTLFQPNPTTKGIYKREAISEKLFASSIQMEKTSKSGSVQDVPGMVNNPYTSMEESVHKETENPKIDEMVKNMRIEDHQANGYVTDEPRPPPSPPGRPGSPSFNAPAGHYSRPDIYREHRPPVDYPYGPPPNDAYSYLPPEQNGMPYGPPFLGPSNYGPPAEHYRPPGPRNYQPHFYPPAPQPQPQPPRLAKLPRGPKE